MRNFSRLVPDGQFVVQTALSDFYGECRLCAQGSKSAPRRRIEALNHLHANIQDVFNESGVQIMSPHHIVHRAQAQVVLPEARSPGLVRRTGDLSRAACRPGPAR